MICMRSVQPPACLCAGTLRPCAITQGEDEMPARLGEARPPEEITDVCLGMIISFVLVLLRVFLDRFSTRLIFASIFSFLCFYAMM